MAEYTEEQIQELINQEKSKWEAEALEPLQNKIQEIQSKVPQELTQEQKEITEKQQQLFNKEVELTLKENGLGDFAQFVKVEKIEDLKTQIDGLKKILAKRTMDNSYKPEDHKNSDAYSQAKSKGDTFAMVKALFSK